MHARAPPDCFHLPPRIEFYNVSPRTVRDHRRRLCALIAGRPRRHPGASVLCPALPCAAGSAHTPTHRHPFFPSHVTFSRYTRFHLHRASWAKGGRGPGGITMRTRANKERRGTERERAREDCGERRGWSSKEKAGQMGLKQGQRALAEEHLAWHLDLEQRTSTTSRWAGLIWMDALLEVVIVLIHRVAQELHARLPLLHAPDGAGVDADGGPV